MEKKLKIVERLISELKNTEYNPRKLSKSEHKEIKESLEEFGIIDPIIVNKHKTRNDIIIGGNMRTKIWKELGNKKIPTVEVSLTLKKEKELNIRLNKNTASFDYEILAEAFEIQELTSWGFDDDELLKVNISALAGEDEKVDYSDLIQNRNKTEADPDKVNCAIIKLEYDMITHDKIMKKLKDMKESPTDIFLRAVMS